MFFCLHYDRIWSPGSQAGKLKEMECHIPPPASQHGIRSKVMDFSHTPLLPSGNHPHAYLQGLALLQGAKLLVKTGRLMQFAHLLTRRYLLLMLQSPGI